MNSRVLVGVASCAIAFASISSLLAVDIPKPLKARFVTGDPVWRELPVREDLRNQYEKCWQTAVSTILENNFDIATMDKDSGYVRTTWNEGVVVLGGRWTYRVQLSLKFVYAGPAPGAGASPSPTIDKVQLQAAGEIAESKKGNVRAFFRGYDQVLLEDVFQDLQAKLGAR
jgi:hypothetical protein